MFINSFFKIVLGFVNIMFFAIFAWNGVYACVQDGFVVGLFCDICKVFNGF